MANINVTYQVYAGGRWLPWVKGMEDYAGVYGQAIEAIQAEIISGSSGGGGGEILPPVVGGRKVFIDPGHGGKDPGAVGNGMNEKDVVFEISKMVGNILTQQGVTVEYSRKGDTFVELYDIANHANNWGASLFVSIHANSNEGTPGTGTECYTYPTADSRNKQLSANVAKAISNKLGFKNRGHKEANFAVLRLTNMPAILVETAFINNANDANLLRNRRYDFAVAIANEILKYLGGTAPEIDINAFNKYSSNIGLFKGLGVDITASSKIIATLSMVPHITLSAETSTEAKLSHVDSVFNTSIDISKGSGDIAEQLLNLVDKVNIKIPFSKNELTVSLAEISLMTEINSKIAYSVKILPNAIEVTLESKFKYNSKVTGYQRVILSVESSIRHKYNPVVLRASAFNPAYNTLPEYSEEKEIAGLPARFKFPNVNYKPNPKVVCIISVATILTLLKLLGVEIAALFLLE